MYGFLSEGVGQFSFSPRAFTTPIQSSVYVTVAIQRIGRLRTPPPPPPLPSKIPTYYHDYKRFELPLLDSEIPARGWVSRSNFDAAVNWLNSQGGAAVYPMGENRYWLTVTRTQLPEVLRLLGLEGQGFQMRGAVVPSLPQNRFAQIRSRGGAMAPSSPPAHWLTGIAATGIGYALGGLPGAALGAAAALLKGKFDETRVG